ncbi:autotransporter-associated beta strand repeat-containing protein, partial [Brucella anthropi]|uniref:autotransporter-associated beta strand repeat-containing protein n=1 Tax=Brucella anthropi TaxID=529 RepID=UPI00235FF70A
IISAGTLQIGSGDAQGAVFAGGMIDTGEGSNNGILAFDRSDDALVISGIISGTGSVAQIGSGTTTLTGENTYTGGTDLQAGTLSVASDGNLGASIGKVFFKGGTLRVTDDITTSREMTLSSLGGTISVDATKAITISGGIRDALLAKGSLTKTGEGTLILTAQNNY